jgi:hypothetical protein
MNPTESNPFSIVLMTGNPTSNEIAVLSSAISVWLTALSTQNPQGNNTPVDNYVETLSWLRLYNRNSLDFAQNVSKSGRNSGKSLSLANRVRSRK